MLLAIDIGNTNMVLGVHGEGGWMHQWRIHTDRDKMTDEYAVLLRSLLQEADLQGERLDRVALASVVPPLTSVIAETVHRVLGLKPLIIGPGVRTGIRVRVDVRPE